MGKRLFFLSATLFLPSLFILIWGEALRTGFNSFGQDPIGRAEDESILIDALLYDGYELNDADEAVALRNLSDAPIDLSGWKLLDQRGNGSLLPDGLVVLPGAVIWIARNDGAFRRQFGFEADLLLQPWPGFANDGDALVLLDDQQNVVDVLVYEEGEPVYGGWEGPAVEPYTVRGIFGEEGQILYRKLDQRDGLPVSDTNRFQDWAQDKDDVINGRKVRYPGWDLHNSFFTTQVTETAVLTVAIAPDNVLQSIVEAIEGAGQSIYMQSLTAENTSIAKALSNAASRGVDVKVLLEGSPPGGIANEEKYFCQMLEESGGQCWFMISDADQKIYDRYRYLHGKFIIFDGHYVAISSENLSPNSMPDDDKSDGTWGRRGVVILTDAPSVVSNIKRVFENDLDPVMHADLYRWRLDDPKYGAPPIGFIPISESGGISYSVRYPSPSTFQGNFYFELQQSPENSLRDVDGLLGLLNRARTNDAIWVQQLVERPHWGSATGDRLENPNPRLEAYISAARRGADVRLLLDRYFDDETSGVSNFATCSMLNQIAVNEKLDLKCDLANPTGLGIHNKMILAKIAGQGYIFVGSINGSELSHKGNREMALMVQSNGAYQLLADMFVRDTPHHYFLPLMFSNFRGPANHLLISEVIYDSFGQDEGEFIEIVNPTADMIDLSGYSLSDALSRDDFEDLRRFPPGTVASAGQVLVVATSGQYFWNEYGSWPDFEILETVQAVPNLIDDLDWGSDETFLRLGNTGDEVILRNADDKIIDAMSYGSGSISGQPACLPVSGTNHSLERYPYWHDSDDCMLDFRDWPFPSPGKRPR